MNCITTVWVVQLQSNENIISMGEEAFGLRVSAL